MFTSCRHNIQIALTIYCSNRWLTSDVLSVEVPEVPPPWASVSSWSKSERATNTMESFLLNCSTPSASLQAPGFRVSSPGQTRQAFIQALCVECALWDLPSFLGQRVSLAPCCLCSCLHGCACVCSCVCIDMCTCVQRRVLGKHPAAGWVALQTSSGSCLETAALEW